MNQIQQTNEVSQKAQAAFSSDSRDVRIVVVGDEADAAKDYITPRLAVCGGGSAPRLDTLFVRAASDSAELHWQLCEYLTAHSAEFERQLGSQVETDPQTREP